jgi:hypothetical protein
MYKTTNRARPEQDTRPTHNPARYIANYSSAHKYQAVGTMKAVRFYNRALSDAEVAQNYKVDAARFDGVLVDANVVVAGETLSLDMSDTP